MNFLFLIIIFFTKLNLIISQHLEIIFAFIYYDPYILPNIFNISIPKIDNYLNKKKLINISCLNNSSKIHADNLAYNNCPFSHTSCNCNFRYQNCDIVERINEYCLFSIESYSELLIKTDGHFFYGLQSLLESNKHQKIFLENSLTHFGIYKSDNIYNINIIKTKTNTNTIKKKKLKNSIIRFNNKSYLFSVHHFKNKNITCIYQNKNQNIFIYEF